MEPHEALLVVAETEEEDVAVEIEAVKEEGATQTVVATAAYEVGLIVAEEVVGSAEEDVVEEVRKEFTSKFSILTFFAICVLFQSFLLSLVIPQLGVNSTSPLPSLTDN